MKGREIGVLGLPRNFSEDPLQRRIDFLQAINLGYERVNRRFGKMAASKWTVNPETVLVFDSTEEFRERVLNDSTDSPEWKAEFVNNPNPPLARTLYSKRKVYVNGPRYANPAEVAQNLAHETIHAWAGRQPIKFQEITLEQLGLSAEDKDVLGNIANETNEALIDFCAFEALGLLKPPITRLEPLRLMNRAYNSLLLRQMAEGFRLDTEDQLFRITQGKFTAAEVAQLNKRMRSNPSDPYSGGFYEYGFLFPLGAIQASRFGFIRPESIPQLINECLVWTQVALGRTSVRLDYLERADVLEAQQRINQNTFS